MGKNYSDLKQYIEKELQKTKFLNEGLDAINLIESLDQQKKEAEGAREAAYKDLDVALKKNSDAQATLAACQENIEDAKKAATKIINGAQDKAASIVAKAEADAEKLTVDTAKGLTQAHEDTAALEQRAEELRNETLELQKAHKDVQDQLWALKEKFA